MSAPPSLYADVIGPRFERLPPAVRAFHGLAGRHVLHGRVRTEVPSSPVAKWCAWCVGAPLRGVEGPLHFELEAGRANEVWCRRFPDRTMTSRLARRGDRLIERLGVVQLFFEPRADDERLDLHLVRVTVLGIPCPRLLRPRIVAREWGPADRVHFDVAVTLPVIGAIARYSGHLDLTRAEDA